MIHLPIISPARRQRKRTISPYLKIAVASALIWAGVFCLAWAFTWATCELKTYFDFNVLAPASEKTPNPENYAQK